MFVVLGGLHLLAAAILLTLVRKVDLSPVQ
jgi:hypothetical protein